MMTFVLIAGGAALFIAILVAWPLVAGRRAAPNQDQIDAQVFRDQLAEIDRDRDRGLISPAEAEGARLEVSRRLLAADARAQASGDLAPGPQNISLAAAALAVLALPIGAAGLYSALGAPGVPDQPLAARALDGPQRPNQQEAERLAAEAIAERDARLPKLPTDPEVLLRIEQLRKILEDRPNDAEGFRLLARMLVQASDYKNAHAAYAVHLRLKPDAGAETWADYAEALILAAGGYVSPLAERALATALEIDPNYPKAMFYVGVSLRVSGRLAEAAKVWRTLLRQSPADAPWRAAVQQALTELSQASGREIPGPSQEDVEAAGQMAPEERQAMIASMVERLETRLTSEGGEVEDWARLMFVYNQMGKPEDAKRIYALGVEAQLENTAKSFLKEQAILLGLDVE